MSGQNGRFGRQGGPAQHEAVPSAAVLRENLPPLRRFHVTVDGVEQPDVLAHEASVGYAAVFQLYIVVGDGQVRQQMVAAFGGKSFVVREDDELPFDAAKSTLAIQ